MRIHTDVLSADDFSHSLADEKRAARIAISVGFKELSEHRSTSRHRGFEVQLGSYKKIEGDGRRIGNSGSYGAMSGEYAATYDEWGWFLAALYREDPNMIVGSKKNPIYKDQSDFRFRTGFSYNPEQLLNWLRAGRDPYPFMAGRASGRVGRVGAGRLAGDSISPLNAKAAVDHYLSGKRTIASNNWVKYAPRTVEEVCAFAHLDTTGVTA